MVIRGHQGQWSRGYWWYFIDSAHYNTGTWCGIPRTRGVADPLRIEAIPSGEANVHG